MMKFGYDKEEQAVALCKSLSSDDTFATVLLTGFGTCSSARCAFQQQEMRAVEAVFAWVSNTINAVVASDSRNNLHYAGTHITDALQKANEQIWAVSKASGQGLYLSGVILYWIDDKYLLFPFGGAAAYSVGANALIRQGNNDSPDGLIYDALGGAFKWRGKCWNGSFRKGEKMLFTSRPLSNLTAAFQHFGAANTDGQSTVAMLVRRTQTPMPEAVIEITCE